MSFGDMSLPANDCERQWNRSKRIKFSQIGRLDLNRCMSIFESFRNGYSQRNLLLYEREMFECRKQGPPARRVFNPERLQCVKMVFNVISKRLASLHRNHA